jgi:hypothetical protein
MGLVDIINQGPPRRGNSCAIGIIINSLSQEEQEAVNSAIEKIRSQEPGFSASWLHRVLMSEGHKIGQSTLMRHVAKGCACESK